MSRRPTSRQEIAAPLSPFIQALDHSNDGIILTDGNGRILFINRLASQLTGVGSEYAQGRTLAEVYQVFCEDRESVREHPVDEVIRSRQQYSTPRPLSLRTPDGKFIAIEETISPLFENTDVIGVTITFRNITVQREIEKQIVFQASLLDHVQNSVVAADMEGRILYWNRAAEELYGWKAEEVLGKCIYDTVVPEARRAASRSAFLEWKEDGKLDGETVEMRKDGSTFPSYSLITPFTDWQGRRIGFVGLSRDLTQQRQAQQALNQSLSLLAATLEATEDGILVVDLHGSITAWNQNFITMWGIPEEVIASGEDGQALSVALGKLKDPDGFIDKVQQLYSDPLAESLDNLLLLDGRIFERSSKPQLLDAAAVGRVWSFRDITDRRRTEEELRQQTSLHESLLRAQSDMGEGLAIIGLTNIYYANDAIATITGYTIEELLAMPDLFEAIAPEEREKLKLQMASRIAGGPVPNHYETAIIHKNGGRIDVEVAIKQRLGVEQVQLVVLLRDITVRKEIERSLSTSESKFRTVVENLGEGLIITDRQDRILYVNARLSEVSGYSPSECIGQIGYELLLRESEWPDVAQRIAERLGGNAGRYEMEMLCKDGSTRWCSVNAVPYYDHNGEIIGTVGAITDIHERKQQEIVLRRAEERFRYMTLATQDAVYDWVFEDNQVWWNESFTNLFGHTAEQQSLVSWKSWLHPDDLSRVTHSIDKAISERNTKWSDEYRFLRADGTYAHVVDRGYLVYEDDKATRMIGAMMDITDRKRAIEELKAAAANTLAIIENTTDAIVSVDRDLRLITFNSSFQTTFAEHNGWDVYPGYCLRDSFKEDELRFWDAIFSRAFSGEHFMIERERRLNGLPRTYEMFFNPIRENDQVIGVAIFDTDITHRKQAEDLLRQNKENLRALIETSSDSIWSIDADYRLITFNSHFQRSFELVFGHPPAAGMDLRSRLTVGHQAVWKKWYERVLSGERFTAHHERKLGEDMRYFEVSFNPILSGDQVVGASIFSSEITERKLMEQQILGAKEKAEEMSRLKSSFLANMSHEIRTPMTAILGFASIIRELSDSKELHEYAMTIERSGSRLLDTINGILDLAKIEADKIELRPETLDLATEVRKHLDLFRPLIENKHLRLRVDLESTANVTIDPLCFGQIITNLVGNAVKFTSDGSISITCGLSEGNNCFVRVQDTGIGISPDFLPFVFDEFKQESGGYDRNFEGSGLGLTISRKLAELMGGSIAASSTLGVGSEFVVTFPVVEATRLSVSAAGILESRVETRSEREMPPKELPHVLLVEDTPDTADMIKIFVRGHCTIDLAYSADEALKRTAAKQYDAVLMDLNLGRGASGLDVTRELRSKAEYASTPIIALTAYAMKGDREIALEAGCTDYLSKPFSKSQLVEKLRFFLDHKKD